MPFSASRFFLGGYVLKIYITAALGLLASSSFATLINFDDGSVNAGNVLSNQYAAQGVTFAAGNTTGASISPSGLGGSGFATNTDMTIVSLSGGDVGGGAGAPMSGLILRSFNGWLNEDNDAIFTMSFTDQVTSISVVFGGIADTGSTRIFAVNGANAVVASATASTTGTQTLSLTGLSGVNRIVVTPGDFNDWVGVDNIDFTTAPVPEPASMTALGLGVAALIRRRRNKKA